MTLSHSSEFTCQICGKKHSVRRMIPLGAIRASLSDRIAKDYPNLDWHGYICNTHLNEYRMLYVQEILREEKGELSALDASVLESMAKNETLVTNTEKEWRDQISFGQRCADIVASFGGSWAFLFAFALVMSVWIWMNASDILAFDPYPFILLNLCLSCLAAVQAPIIMMSQNRQEARDRMRSENDYRVNLKAELEIRNLHEKIDHLLSHQWERLIEIQQIQIDIMRDLESRGSKN